MKALSIISAPQVRCVWISAKTKGKRRESDAIQRGNLTDEEEIEAMMRLMKLDEERYGSQRKLAKGLGLSQKEFFTLRNPRTKHVRMPRFIDETNNNIIERLQGTVRERDKVMRAFKKEESAQKILDGFRAYYNFIRPNQALRGKTPAEKANIMLNLKGNKWLELVRKSRKNSLD